MADENTEVDGNKIANSCESAAHMQMDMFSDTWGFSLEDLYKIALTFYRGLYLLFRLVCGKLIF